MNLFKDKNLKFNILKEINDIGFPFTLIMFSVLYWWFGTIFIYNFYDGISDFQRNVVSFLLVYFCVNKFFYDYEKISKELKIFLTLGYTRKKIYMKIVIKSNIKTIIFSLIISVINLIKYESFGYFSVLINRNLYGFICSMAINCIYIIFITSFIHCLIIKIMVSKNRRGKISRKILNRFKSLNFTLNIIILLIFISVNTRHKTVILNFLGGFNSFIIAVILSMILIYLNLKNIKKVEV
ncbi:hypothetical protein [Clostridium rectalis]|uniref:hypothetical protein n=1 Tax=Clostridium rectalis TaxID=2040295 RepID=UPI000F64134C|nr:hypothetical protein [Clostridium rectalis]